MAYYDDLSEYSTIVRGHIDGGLTDNTNKLLGSVVVMPDGNKYILTGIRQIIILEIERRLSTAAVIYSIRREPGKVGDLLIKK